MLQPLVIAHRGVSSEQPEQTFPAYRAAIEVGADGVECDVRLTRDGQVICLHDSRVDRTSDGSGPVSRMDLGQLDSLDWRKGRADLPIEPAMTLPRLLELVTAAKRPMEVLIETKHPVRPAGEIERRVASLLADFGLDQGAREGVRVRVMSFSVSAVQRMRKLAPQVPLVQLVAVLPPRVLTGWLPRGVGAVGPSMDAVRKDPALVERHRQRGHEVYVWTVNEPADVQICREAGVTGIITDRPRQVRAQLASHPG